MTKKEFLTAALKAGGVKGRIYESVKELKHAAGTQYAAILRISDQPVRATSKKTYQDQEGVTMVRRKLYQAETVYNVVLTDSGEESLEKLLEGFLSNLEKGYYDDAGNWVGVTPEETDWVDEEDSVMKAKVAVQVKVVCRYGIYRDVSAGVTPGEVDMEFLPGDKEEA